MSSPTSSTPASAQPEADPKPDSQPSPISTDPKPSYTKLAMRNMVRKSGTSLKHFALTTIGLLAVLVALAYLTR